VIRDPNHFQYDPKRFGLNYHSLVMIILQIKDHFYGSQIIFADHGLFLRIADYFADRRLFDVAEK